MDTLLWLAAETGTNGEDTGLLGGPYGMLIIMGAIFVVFYLVLIRPQRKKEQQRQQRREEMLAGLARNDHVMTIGGIRGVITNINEDAGTVTIRVDEKNDVRMQVSRDAVSRVEGEEAPEDV